ncbi:MAG TPA: hypothetical protein VFT66_08920 [Roseiflexaceae bacterium]|nr:hypothetical protein [Roseiflexaceae bacterium]
MNWIHRLRVQLLPVTRAQAQKRVDAVDHALAKLRTEVASLPADERAARAREIQMLVSEQARVRNILSDALDDRAER